LGFVDKPVPLSVQMLRLRFIATASGSITTAIGASLEQQFSVGIFMKEPFINKHVVRHYNRQMPTRLINLSKKHPKIS